MYKFSSTVFKFGKPFTYKQRSLCYGNIANQLKKDDEAYYKAVQTLAYDSAKDWV